VCTVVSVRRIRKPDVQGRLGQSDIGRFPDPLPHVALHLKQLPRDAQVERSQKAPEGALWRQFEHVQDPDQHRLPLQKAQMVQPREAYVAGQHHRQHESAHRHGSGLALDGETLFDQLLEVEFLQQGRHRQQSSVSGQIPRPEVIRRGSPDFIGLRRNVTNPLFGGLSGGILVSIVHHLGGS
jgi:hypothetical protein